MRICIVGDELVAGSGDPRGLGWVGRVLSRTELPPNTHVFTLARVDESTSELAARWLGEVSPRIDRNSDNRLVVAIGKADVERAVSTPRTRLNIASILDSAIEQGLTPMVVGPPPLMCSDRKQLQQVARACREVCERRSVFYVDTYSSLAEDDQWHDDLAMSPTNLPGQAGYGKIAWLTLHFGWCDWLGVPARQAPSNRPRPRQ